MTFKVIPFNEELDKHCNESTLSAVKALIERKNGNYTELERKNIKTERENDYARQNK